MLIFLLLMFFISAYPLIDLLACCYSCSNVDLSAPLVSLAYPLIDLLACCSFLFPCWSFCFFWPSAYPLIFLLPDYLSLFTLILLFCLSVYPLDRDRPAFMLFSLLFLLIYTFMVCLLNAYCLSFDLCTFLCLHAFLWNCSAVCFFHEAGLTFTCCTRKTPP